MARTPIRLLILLSPAVLGLALLGGCAGSSGNTELTLTSAQYTDAFQAAKDALAEYRFELDRVDAGAGVITSMPKASQGIATPWDFEQSSFEQELEDLANRHLRRVRITFEPVSPAEDPQQDLRTATGPIVGRVEVIVDRVRRAGWRLEPTSVRLSTFTRDPDLVARGMWPQYTVPISQDPEFAARLADGIRRRMGSKPAASADAAKAAPL